MRRRYLVPGVLALCALPAAGWTGTTTIFSENFDELTPMLGATSVGAFTAINGTNVDILGGNLFGDLCNVRPESGESGNCIDLNGTGGNPQGVLRSNAPISLVPGLDYTLFYTLNGSQRGNTTSATWCLVGTIFCGTQTVASGDLGGTSVSGMHVNAPTTAFLTFAADQGGDLGPLLDSVVITASTPVITPEPATLGLLVFGLAGVGFARRKRKY